MRCSLVSSGLCVRFRPTSCDPHSALRSSAWFYAALFALVSALSQPALGNPDEHTNGRQWTHQAQLKTQARDALETLRTASQHGLPENRYALSRLNLLAENLQSDINAQQFNELLTAALETYTIDLIQGLQPSAFVNRGDPKYRKNARHTVSSQLRTGVLKGLHRAIKTNRLSKFMRSIEPAHKDYALLKTELRKHKALVARGGWPLVRKASNGESLRVGAYHPQVLDLRARLAVTDISVERNPATNPQRYDKRLEQAVMRFQTRHGLTGDGVVGESTLTALNVTAAQRVQQIELNLDRFRLLPRVMPANHIWVNVPQYEMTLQLDREQVLDMRVVVGKTSSPTPMMHDVLEHLVFSPYWYPTKRISREEILPAIKADPHYLVDHRFDVLKNNKPIDPSGINWQAIKASNLRYQFRQRPGKGNSLGDVKFIFPNNYSVYLHDSNTHHLFDKSMRAYSHGCVRVEDPESLATALLAWDSGWKREKVSRAMASGRQKYVKLGQTIPVYLVYFTATVKDGVLNFHNDLYGHDKRHTAKLRLSAQQDNEGKGNSKVAQVLKRYPTISESHAAPQLVSISMSPSSSSVSSSGPDAVLANANPR